MSAYEIALLWGSLALAIAVLAGYGAFTDKVSYWFAILLSGIGGGLIYKAYLLNDMVLDINDVPVAIYRLIGVFLN